MFVAILRQDADQSVHVIARRVEGIMAGIDAAGDIVKEHLQNQAMLLVNGYEPSGWFEAATHLKTEFSVHAVSSDGGFGDQLWSLLLTPAGFVVAAEWQWQASGRSLDALEMHRAK